MGGTGKEKQIIRSAAASVVNRGNGEEDNWEEREARRKLNIYCWGHTESIGSDMRVRGEAKDSNRSLQRKQVIE